MARALPTLLTFLLCAVAAAQPQNQPQSATPQAPQTTPAAAAGYVGGDVCKTCHADIWAFFYKNAHFRSIAMGKTPPDRTGCEGCHGPAKAHIEAGGGKNTIPHAFSLMKPSAVLEDCLTCHAKDMSKPNIQRSEHTLNGVACTSCHSIHHSVSPRFLLAKKQNEMCYGCHADIRARFEMPSHHRVNEGFMTCTDCHNPHGGFAATTGMATHPTMLLRSAQNGPPCLNCHIDKRGPFIFEHPSVAVEGCSVCHNPHGSVNNKLLTRPVVFTICLECHNGTGTGTRNAGVDIQTARHNLLDPKFQKCTVCHVKIHGSNADPYFLR
jgi:DmsE family decaheme c-type cytochrome